MYCIDVLLKKVHRKRVGEYYEEVWEYVFVN